MTADDATNARTGDATVTVRMQKRAGPLRAGEVVGLPSELADRFVREGFAIAGPTADDVSTIPTGEPAAD